MPAFEAARIGTVAFPGLLIAGGVSAVNLATRAMDAKAGRITALTKFNTWAHIGMMGAAAYLLGTNKAPDLAATIMIADAVPLSDRLLTPLIEQAVGVKMAATGAVSQREALAPGRSPAEIRAQQQRLLQEGKVQSRWPSPRYEEEFTNVRLS